MVENTKKTSTMTFRLDDEIIKKLRTESHDREISTNTLVNQALKRFLEWDVYQSRSGFVSINRPVFVKIFEKLKREEVIDLASNIGKIEVENIALFMKGKEDLESFISWFEIRMINSSVQVSHTNENGCHRYSMKHDVGINWSLYHKTILQLIFEEVFKQKVDIQHNKSMISFQFSE
ncbi:MAG: CopG family ribbon-helix-helix protein [Nitrosotalea sp.]